MTIEKAIESVSKHYEYALTQKWIRNPIAWALHQAWKEVDHNSRYEHFEEQIKEKKNDRNGSLEPDRSNDSK